MRRDDVIARLKQTEPALRGVGVGALYLFGSHARDDANPKSDIDIFVEPLAGEAFGFLPFMSARQILEDAMDCPVDYGTRTGLHPGFRPDIEREAIKVF